MSTMQQARIGESRPTETSLPGGATAYLTVREAAEILRIAPKTLRAKMASGVFDEGIHFIRRRGLGPRFIRRMLEDWLNGDDSYVERLRQASAVSPDRSGTDAAIRNTDVAHDLAGSTRTEHGRFETESPDRNDQLKNCKGDIEK